jgi:hypothetical protein
MQILKLKANQVNNVIYKITNKGGSYKSYVSYAIYKA